MPIYEYACKACGHEFEEWQKLSDAPVRKCPSCGKRRVEKLVSMTSFQLKGGGWYADGYASKKSGSTADAAKSAGSSDSGSSDSGSSDSGSSDSGSSDSGSSESGSSESGSKNKSKPKKDAKTSKTKTASSSQAA